MIMVYYKIKLKQSTVTFESMTLSDFADFERRIVDGKVKAYIIGVTVSII